MKEKLFQTAEQKRLDENALKDVPLELWGPYLSERQWGTVREDYSANGDAWNYVTHDQARSKAYRWGEDGIAGISDFNQNLCFSLAFWNHKDPILKERLFGLTNGEGNHGEDCKELYFYLDNTPTHSYMRMLYKYAQAEFPYEELIKENARRNKLEPEYELLDTGIFDDGHYFDIYVEYAKRSEKDILINIVIINRGGNKAPLTILPTLWFRNYWSDYPGAVKPIIKLVHKEDGGPYITAEHPTFGTYYLYFPKADAHLFTENETNTEKLYGIPGSGRVKDAFHEVIIGKKDNLISGDTAGTKFSPVYQVNLEPYQKTELTLRLSEEALDGNVWAESDFIIEERKQEELAFFHCLAPVSYEPDLHKIMHQAVSGLLWSKQFYYYDVDLWLRGDPGSIPPPEERKYGRNSSWSFLNNKDIILMPDTWEYPWYAAWDLAFHCIPWHLPILYLRNTR
jgi:hypothetical protein